MNVIFFDGVCGLCNGFIDFVMKIDKKQVFKFSPLQSEFAQVKLPPHMTQDLKTIVFLSNNGPLTKSDAVLEIFKTAGGIWKIISYTKILPKDFRDHIYNTVAENRYRLFGKKTHVVFLLLKNAHASLTKENLNSPSR